MRRSERIVRVLEPVDDGLPTVREILTLDAVAQGVPEVLSGGDALDARVRWVHVSDSAGVARLLNGGELLLSTGSGWPTDPGELEAFIAALVDVGLAGPRARARRALPLRAGRRRVGGARARPRPRRPAPRGEVRDADRGGAQPHHLRADGGAAGPRRGARALHRARLRGSPADFIVQQLAQTLGAPVVLENLAHEVVAAEVPLAAEVELFTRWETRSRAAHRHDEQRRLGGAVGPTSG